MLPQWLCLLLSLAYLTFSHAPVKENGKNGTNSDQFPLPQSYGIYAVDNGKLTCLTKPQSTEEREQRLLFSEGVYFVVFHPKLKDPTVDLGTIKLYDWRHWSGQPPPVTRTVKKRVTGQPSMITVKPEKPLQPGLFEVDLWNQEATSAYGDVGVRVFDLVKFWEEVLAEIPDSWQAHNHLGAILYCQGKYDESAPHFERAVELKPDNPEVHNNLGLVLWRHREDPVMRERAIKEYEKAVEIKGEVVALRQNLAGALIETGRYEDAVQQYKAMLKWAPKDANMHAALGALQAQLGRYAEAKQEFETALQLDPNNATAKKNIEALQKLEQKGK